MIKPGRFEPKSDIHFYRAYLRFKYTLNHITSDSEFQFIKFNIFLDTCSS